MGGKFKLPEQDYEWPVEAGVPGRFRAKFEEGPFSECWNWQAVLNGAGYGMIRNGQRMALAHRMAWVLDNNMAVPEGLHVLHTCDNPACVNPMHLKVGTNADNISDKVKRGRSSFPHPERRGEKHPMAKLTDAQVVEIVASYTGRRGEIGELAKQYGVSYHAIYGIVKKGGR